MIIFPFINSEAGGGWTHSELLTGRGSEVNASDYLRKETLCLLSSPQNEGVSALADKILIGWEWRE
jgi:hypothetical protein